MNMKWSEQLTFHQPLHHVALLEEAPPETWESLVRTRESAAYQRGRQDVETALADQLAQQQATLNQLQNGLLQSLRDALPQIIRESETALIELALEASRRVVAGLAIDAPMVEAIVREALRQVEDTAEILIKLHPEDLTLLRKHEAQVLQGLPDKGPLRFIGSSEVSRGGCLVQTRFGVVDARREVKLQQLAESLSV